MNRICLNVIRGALLIMTAGTPLVANAQSSTCGVLKGQVFDSSRVPIEDSYVRVVNMANPETSYWGKRTDDKGFYIFDCLLSGDYRITASMDGYEKNSVIVRVQITQTTKVKPWNITLRGLASLKGEVLDPGGRGVPSAVVTILDDTDTTIRFTQADANGRYEFDDLMLGHYKVQAFHKGESSTGIGFATLNLRQQNQVALPIVVVEQTTPNSAKAKTAPAGGQAKETVAPVQVVHLSDAARSVNFNAQEIVALPIGGSTAMRSFDELALLLAGVAPPPYTPGVRGPGVGFGIGTAGEFSVNGMRARSNNFSIDGSDNNDPDVGVRRQGFIALVPQSAESVLDLSISTLLWDAELGRGMGAQVNAVSKYGSDKYHGQAYIFFTDSKLNARNFFDYSGGPSQGKDPFTRAQAGLTIGGPLVNHRTQFFGSFEHDYLSNSTEQHFATPTMTERRFLGPTRFDVLPLITSTEILKVRSGATPGGQNVLSFYPEPNDPGGPFGNNTYTDVLPANGKGDVFSFKLTHQVREGSSLDLRYNFTGDTRELPSVNSAIRSTVIADTRTQDLSLIFAGQLGPRLFSQARFSYGRTRLGFSPYPGSPFLFSKALPPRLLGEKPIPQTGSIGELIIEPYSPVGIDAYTFPQARVNNTFQIGDTLSATVGGHSVKLGGDIRHHQFNSLNDRLYRPLVVYGYGQVGFGKVTLTANPKKPVDFSPSDTPKLLSGVQLAATGVPTSVFQTLTEGTPNSRVGLRTSEYKFFFNDNWRLRTNLNIDYGLRYEYSTVPHEVNRRIENDIELKNLPMCERSSAFYTPGRCAAYDATVAAYKTVLQGRTQIYEPDRNNFGPHLGLAWDPGGDSKTAIRAGYGIYYDALLGSVVSQSRNVFPGEIQGNFNTGFDIFSLSNPALLRVYATPPDYLSLIAPETGNQVGGTLNDFAAIMGEIFRLERSTGAGLGFTLPDKKLRTPYAQQCQITFEREIVADYLITASYVGTKGTKLTRIATPNLGPNALPFIAVATKVVSSDPKFSPPPLALVVAASSLPNSTPKRMSPALGPYQIFESSASSSYHALQLEARKRFSHGVQFSLAYTWSHAIDDVSDVFPIAGAPVIAQDSTNLRLERGDSNFDVRHRFSASVIADLPFSWKSKPRLERWISGWQFASIFQAQTGQPYTINLPVDANLDGNLTDRPSTTDGLIYFSGHGSKRIALARGKQLTDFFTFGQNGYVGRNTFRGDSFVNLDVALNKKFHLTSDEYVLEFRAESYNLLNRANFALPVRVIDAPGFGSSVDTVNPARVIQFALKLSF